MFFVLSFSIFFTLNQMSTAWKGISYVRECPDARVGRGGLELSLAQWWLMTQFSPVARTDMSYMQNRGHVCVTSRSTYKVSSRGRVKHKTFKRTPYRICFRKVVLGDITLFQQLKKAYFTYVF